MILAVVVTGADTQDRDRGKDVLAEMKGMFHRLTLIWADGGYAGNFVDFAKRRFKRTIEIVKRSNDVKGFKVLPERWIVEGTFDWFSKYRRLSKGYQVLPESNEARIRIARVNLTLHRLDSG